MLPVSYEGGHALLRLITKTRAERFYCVAEKSMVYTVNSEK